MKLAARSAVALRLNSGQQLRITNTHGQQVVDTWALAEGPVLRFLSTPHTWMHSGRIRLQEGDALLDNTRETLLTLVEDTSPGHHDMVMPSCDPQRYQQLGAEGYHANCCENYEEALRVAQVKYPGFVPQPVNLFQHVPIAAGGGIVIAEPTARPGDYVTLRAEQDIVVIISACPQDMAPTNGTGREPTGVEYEVLD